MKEIREKLMRASRILHYEDGSLPAIQMINAAKYVDEALSLLPPEGQTRDPPCITTGGCSLGGPYSCGMACAEPAPSSEKALREHDARMEVHRNQAEAEVWRLREALKNIDALDQFGRAATPQLMRSRRDAALASSPAPEAPKEGWTGKPCPKCQGTGIDDPERDIRACSACGGTGEEYKSAPDSLKDCSTCAVAKETSGEGTEEDCAGCIDNIEIHTHWKSERSATT